MGGMEDRDVSADSWLIERSGWGESSGEMGTAVKLVEEMLEAMAGA